MAGVSAAEKYAELELRGEERPKCECHGETMGWQKYDRLLAGGRWRCVKSMAETNRRWVLTLKGRESQRRSDRKRAALNPGRSTPYTRKHQNKKDQARIDALLEQHPWLREAHSGS